MCAPGVPARISQGVPAAVGLVGRPVSAAVMPGTSTTHMPRAVAWVLPIIMYMVVPVVGLRP